MPSMRLGVQTPSRIGEFERVPHPQWVDVVFYIGAYAHGRPKRPAVPRQSWVTADLPPGECRACFEEYLEFGYGARCDEHVDRPLAEVVELPKSLRRRVAAAA
jgi:hypothetical protein